MEAEGAADGHGADHAQRPKRAAAVAAAKRIYKVFAAFSSAESSTTRREASLRVPRSRLLLLQSGQRLAYRRRIDSPWRHRLHEVADLVIRCRYGLSETITKGLSLEALVPPFAASFPLQTAPRH